MKTRVTLLIGTIALVSLSFTFVSGEKQNDSIDEKSTKIESSAPAGGFIADEIIK